MKVGPKLHAVTDFNSYK